MFTAAVITIFIVIVLGIVYLEYRNEKRYQAERRSRHAPKPTPPSASQDHSTETKTETPASSKIQKPAESEEKSLTLPVANYGRFDHNRLIEMGLSEEEAVSFVKELIEQIKAQIPLIKEAIEEKDFTRMERLTHSLKGSATNIGTGGIADLLVKYNTYLKTGKELPIAKGYFKHLEDSLEQLNRQYA